MYFISLNMVKSLCFVCLTLIMISAVSNQTVNIVTSTLKEPPFLWSSATVTSPLSTTPTFCSCVLIQLCPAIRGLLKKYRGSTSVKSYIENLICGYEGRYAKVYCPQYTNEGNLLENSDPDHIITYRLSNCNARNKNGINNNIGYTSASKNIITSTKPSVTVTLNDGIEQNKINKPSVLSLAASNEVPLANVCGQTTIIRDRLVGGERPSLDDWPWIVALGYKTNSKPNNPLRWSCTGALITESYVITTAHCTTASALGTQELSAVRLGDLNLNPIVNDGALSQDALIEKIIVHESYNVDKYSNDIALLKLKTPVKFNQHIKPICLPVSSNMRSKTYVKYSPTVAGWDSTPSRQIRNTAMSEVYTPIIDLTVCKSIFANESVVIDNSVFCAGYLIGGNNSCLNGSGNPMMLLKNKQWYVLGITSYDLKCAERGFPTVFTRVSHFVNWINNKIKNE
ncbi:venom protease-like isoform X2 [Adelges cooleyi]|uniref:venom protease-like isoform X2 n=1 Tax=Adelges cooleyi TaxID=133065 RepID=UPI00217F7CA5|nr:venom protease-like isoform X2 [Adelges cooleyi]